MDEIQRFKTHTNNNYEFSDFQTEACLSIVEDKHVLITAHTGSGKTLPAEFSIYYNIKVKGKKVIYTSPIKALSNQKYKEFSAKFSDIEVGILTGDIKHNPTADLLIVTTEILQNHNSVILVLNETVKLCYFLNESLIKMNRCLNLSSPGPSSSRPR